MHYTPTANKTWDLGQQFPVGWGLCRLCPATWLIGFFGTARLTPASPPPARRWPVAVAAGWLACFPWRRRQPNRAHLTSALPFWRLTLWWYWRSIRLFSACDCEVVLLLGLVRTIDSDREADADVATETKLCCAGIAASSVVYVQAWVLYTACALLQDKAGELFGDGIRS